MSLLYTLAFKSQSFVKGNKCALIRESVHVAAATQVHSDLGACYVAVAVYLGSQAGAENTATQSEFGNIHVSVAHLVQPMTNDMCSCT